jgi:hypothetical protein
VDRIKSLLPNDLRLDESVSSAGDGFLAWLISVNMKPKRQHRQGTSVAEGGLDWPQFMD